ncbi:MAG TPA: hypothetical protein DDW86_07950 [Clostridiales bacterium]|nr:hypothetical protein [Clostridiales bacterium]
MEIISYRNMIYSTYIVSISETVVVELAKEAVEAIRRAEQEADQIVKDASAKGAKMIADAKNEANGRYEKRISEAREKARIDLEAAGQQGADLITKTLRQAEKETESLRKSAEKKEQTAIQWILSNIL